MSDAQIPLPIIDVVIPRSQWYRGHGSKGSALLVTDGSDRMCRLGHVGLACGVEKEFMRGIPSPIALKYETSHLLG